MPVSKQITGSSYDDVRLPVSIRAYTPFYAASVLLFVFFAVLSLYLEFQFVAAALFAIGLIAVPLLRATDKIVFDGRRLVRTGILPRLWLRANGMRTALKLKNIEQVDTITAGSFRRGGRVRFLHRTSVFGNAPAMVFSGTGKRYRRMIRALLPTLEAQILDRNSLELRQHCVEPHEAILATTELRIPSSDVLAPSILKKLDVRKRGDFEASGDELLAERLRRAANQLSATGSLIRAFEAYRRALFIDRQNAWLLYEFAMSCSTLARVERSDDLQHRAAAALRLAERRAGGDAELLERIGETYREFGYSKRAATAYQAAIEKIDNCFRALIGLAELALDEGKLAHVVHNFSAANRAIKSAALRKWTRSEADYFSRLAEDDEYMEIEVSRLNLVEKLDRWRSTAFRIAFYSIPLIAAGAIFGEPLVINTGWLVSAVSFLLWAAMSIGFKMLSTRIPFELVAND